MSKQNRLQQRLQEKGVLICAEGYVFELERRCCLQAGPFVPEVVLEDPEALRRLHEEFVRAGSDVVVACTYYAHAEKMRVVDKHAAVEKLNRKALAIAKSVAKKFDVLLAGDISNTNVWVEKPSDELLASVRHMFEDQVKLAAEAKVDYVIGETFAWLGEALLALEVIKAHGLPAAITLSILQNGLTRDGISVEDALQKLEANGADIVGFNCTRGPDTMYPLVERAVKCVKIPVAALPVPYRTTDSCPTFFGLKDSHPDAQTPWQKSFPTALEPFGCTRYEMAKFAERCVRIGAKYVGGCCGTSPAHIRAMSEAVGRKPLSSRYSPDMSKHFALGTNPQAAKVQNTTFAARL